MFNLSNFGNWGPTPMVPPVAPAPMLTQPMQNLAGPASVMANQGPSFMDPVMPTKSPVLTEALAKYAPTGEMAMIPDAAAAAGVPAAAPGWGQWMRDIGLLGTTDKNGMRTDGWGGLALGGLSAAGNLFMGMQQYNLAKESLANSKAQFERNYEAQKTTTNSALEDRQRARVAANSGAYESVGSYMERNRVK